MGDTSFQVIDTNGRMIGTLFPDTCCVLDANDKLLFHYSNGKLTSRKDGTEYNVESNGAVVKNDERVAFILDYSRFLSTIQSPITSNEIAPPIYTPDINNVTKTDEIKKQTMDDYVEANQQNPIVMNQEPVTTNSHKPHFNIKAAILISSAVLLTIIALVTALVIFTRHNSLTENSEEDIEGGLVEDNVSISLPEPEEFKRILSTVDSKQKVESYTETGSDKVLTTHLVYSDSQPFDQVFTYYEYASPHDAKESFVNYYLSRIRTDNYDSVYSGTVRYSNNVDNGYIVFNVSADSNGQFFHGGQYYGGVFFSGKYFLAYYRNTALKESEKDYVDSVFDALNLPNPRTNKMNKVPYRSSDERKEKTLEEAISSTRKQEMEAQALAANNLFYNKVEFEIKENSITIKYFFKENVDEENITTMIKQAEKIEKEGLYNTYAYRDKELIEQEFGIRPEEIAYGYYKSNGQLLFISGYY